MAGDLASKFGSTDDFNQLLGLLQAELQKTAYPQTITTTNDLLITEIDYDTDIQNRQIKEAPFLAFLQNKGRVKTSTSAIIGWKEKENANGSSFVPELGPISDYGGKTWDTKTAQMKTIIYPISVSLMAQLGNQSIDLVDDDRQDGYLDISAKMDKAMLLGDHTVDANSFDGINKLADASNKKDLNGAEVTMDDVDEVIDAVVAKGGIVDCLVTTARVARQLVKEQQLENITVGNNEFVPGGWMSTYYTPNGIVPIITDRNLVTLDEDGAVDATSEDDLFVVDSSAVINKNLLPVSEFPYTLNPLLKQSLLATFTSFGIKAPWKLGALNGIGKGS